MTPAFALSQEGSAEGWLPAAMNGGWIYRDRIQPAQIGQSISRFYAVRYPHSDQRVWLERLAAGEIHRNGQRLHGDAPLHVGDRLAWHRPPWEEAAVPGTWSVLFDDGDLLVIDKPSGLPVLPAGGFLEHTLLGLLERQSQQGVARDGSAPPGVPRPVHRLGRFTSGLLVCARGRQSRAWLSAQLRDCTGEVVRTSGIRKIYRALTEPGALDLAVGARLTIATAIGLRPHPMLGRIWVAQPGGLPARSKLTLINRRPDGDLVEVEIATGRPHQIRIHCAALGAPLLGDPLYLAGGKIREHVLPGMGGYRLHAHRLKLTLRGGERLAWEAPLPADLEP